MYTAKINISLTIIARQFKYPILFIIVSRLSFEILSNFIDIE